MQSTLIYSYDICLKCDITHQRDQDETESLGTYSLESEKRPRVFANQCSVYPHMESYGARTFLCFEPLALLSSIISKL